MYVGGGGGGFGGEFGGVHVCVCVLRLSVWLFFVCMLSRCV